MKVELCAAVASGSSKLAAAPQAGQSIPGERGHPQRWQTESEDAALAELFMVFQSSEKSSRLGGPFAKVILHEAVDGHALQLVETTAKDGEVIVPANHVRARYQRRFAVNRDDVTYRCL